MKKWSLLCFSFLVFFSHQALSCECQENPGAYLTNLKEAMTDIPPEETFVPPVIVLAEVTGIESGTNSKITIEVKKTLSGKITGRRLRILSGDGGDCGMDALYFQKGSSYVFNLTSHHSRRGVYQVISCGVEFLFVAKNGDQIMVQGALHKPELELLKEKFGDALPALQEKWEREFQEKYAQGEKDFEENLQKLFQVHYGTHWKAKWEAYKASNEDESYVKPFYKKFIALKSQFELVLSKIYHDSQKEMLVHLEEMELNVFVKTVGDILKKPVIR